MSAKKAKTKEVVVERGEHGPKIFSVKCVLGWREYTERFKTAEAARAFVDKVLGKDKWKWKDPTTIVAKEANTLQISCDRLEEVMVRDAGELDKTTADKVQEFLYGVWKEGNKEKVVDVKGAKPVQKSVAPKNQGDTISLDDMCKRNNWEARKARKALRDLGEKKEGRWQWGVSEAESIESKIRKLLK